LRDGNPQAKNGKGHKDKAMNYKKFSYPRFFVAARPVRPHASGALSAGLLQKGGDFCIQENDEN